MLDFNISITDSNPGMAGYSLEKDLNGDLTYSDFSKYLRTAHIGISKDVLKEEQQRGFDKKPRKRIDNVFDKIEEQVKDFGKIEYFAKQSFTEAFDFIYRKIEEKSPVDRGVYENYNYVFYKGSIVARNRTELLLWLENATFTNNDIVRFVNLTPYGRRLEYLGVSKGRQGSSRKTRLTKAGSRYSRFMEGAKKKVRPGDLVSRPNGTYHLVQRSAKARYKSIGKIKHEFLPGNQLVNIPIMSVGKGLSYKARTTFEKDGRPYLYSSIVITLNEAGGF